MNRRDVELEQLAAAFNRAVARSERARAAVEAAGIRARKAESEVGRARIAVSDFISQKFGIGGF
jgi:hypothetical protein